MGKWEMVRLGDVCEVVTGSTPSTRNDELWDGDIKWIAPAEISDDSYFIYDTVKHISEKARLKPMPAGTVLLSSRAPIGKVAIAGTEMCCNQGFKNLICSDKIHNRYLYRYLKNKTEYLNSLGRGATFKEISKAIVENVTIPLPPLVVQLKIADALDRASALIEKRKAQIEKLDLLIKSQFVEMFGDPVANPKGWKMKKLGAVTSKITDGVHQKPVYTNSGVPFISVVNINKGFLNFSDCKFVSDEDYIKMTKSVSPEYGDVLYTKVGATYGIPAFVDTREKFCLYVSVSLIKPIHEKINARFLALSMAMPYVKHQADKRIKGIGVPDLHLNQIREFDICVPPQEEQEIFLHFVQQVEAQKSLLQQSLAKLEQNYKSLIQKCFRGEIF